ncbi:MAG: hypothetical protein WAL41_15455, partial [Mycobacterium sp.]
FDTPHGTRGARQPGGKLMAWVNIWNTNRIRGNAEKVMGMRALVLTTVGAKSGTPRTLRSPTSLTAPTAG